MVEKARTLLSKLPNWWPVLVGIIWLIWSTSAWHTEVMDKINTQEDQIKAIQEYLKHDHNHQKGDVDFPDVGVSSNGNRPPQVSDQPMPSIPNQQ